MTILLKGGRLVYGTGIKCEDLLISDGVITEIREGIPAQEGMQVIDASSFYVLPGFIGSVLPGEEEKALRSGVTTHIKDCSWERIQELFQNDSMGQVGQADYVYQVSLSTLTNASLEWLRKKSVKVITLQQFPKNWREWIPRMERAGFILHLESPDRSLFAEVPLPFIVPYSKMKSTVRKRTILRITSTDQQIWKKKMNQLDPYLIGSYWFDVFANPVPPFYNSIDESFYWMMLVKTMAQTPAKLFGIYPRKGSLGIGADADLLLFSKDKLPTSAEKMLPEKILLGGRMYDGPTHQGRFLSANQTYAFSF